MVNSGAKMAAATASPITWAQFSYGCCLFHGMGVNATLNGRSWLTSSLHVVSTCSCGWNLKEDLLSLQLVMWGPCCRVRFRFALASLPEKASWITPSKMCQTAHKDLASVALLPCKDVTSTISGAAGRFSKRTLENPGVRWFRSRWTRWRKRSQAGK